MRVSSYLGKLAEAIWASARAAVITFGANSLCSPCLPAMSEGEVKRIPKFKRCKITQQQLSALMANFGAARPRISADESVACQTTPTLSHARSPHRVRR